MIYALFFALFACIFAKKDKFDIATVATGSFSMEVHQGILHDEAPVIYVTKNVTPAFPVVEEEKTEETETEKEEYKVAEYVFENIIYETVENVDETGETTTKKVPKVLDSKKYSIKFLNKYEFVLFAEEKEILTAKFVRNEKSAVLSATGLTTSGKRFAFTIYNQLYFKLEIEAETGSIVVYEIYRKREQQQPPAWQKFLSPVLMSVVMFFQMKAQKKNMAQQQENVAAAGEQIKEDIQVEAEDKKKKNGKNNKKEEEKAVEETATEEK